MCTSSNHRPAPSPSSTAVPYLAGAGLREDRWLSGVDSRPLSSDRSAAGRRRAPPRADAGDAADDRRTDSASDDDDAATSSGCRFGGGRRARGDGVAAGVLATSEVSEDGGRSGTGVPGLEATAPAAGAASAGLRPGLAAAAARSVDLVRPGLAGAASVGFLRPGLAAAAARSVDLVRGLATAGASGEAFLAGEAGTAGKRALCGGSGGGVKVTPAACS